MKSFLIFVDFVRSKSDTSLFIRINGSSRMFVLVYVNDIVVIRSVSQEIDEFVRQLHLEFSLKDMGDLHYFLGIEVTRLDFSSLYLC